MYEHLPAGDRPVRSVAVALVLADEADGLRPPVPGHPQPARQLSQPGGPGPRLRGLAAVLAGPVQQLSGVGGQCRHRGQAQPPPAQHGDGLAAAISEGGEQEPGGLVAGVGFGLGALEAGFGCGEQRGQVLVAGQAVGAFAHRRAVGDVDGQLLAEQVGRRFGSAVQFEVQLHLVVVAAVWTGRGGRTADLRQERRCGDLKWQELLRLVLLPRPVGRAAGYGHGRCGRVVPADRLTGGGDQVGWDAVALGVDPAGPRASGQRGEGLREDLVADLLRMGQGVQAVGEGGEDGGQDLAALHSLAAHRCPARQPHPGEDLVRGRRDRERARWTWGGVGEHPVDVADHQLGLAAPAVQQQHRIPPATALALRQAGRDDPALGRTRPGAGRLAKRGS
ncbi:hypothetical protein EDD99_5401 [Streptomyces sp. 846.5]|nr:hypothetical protein EDD99_5401 [Streptomyces sp. 846.5]